MVSARMIIGRGGPELGYGTVPLLVSGVLLPDVLVRLHGLYEVASSVGSQQLYALKRLIHSGQRLLLTRSAV